MAGYEGLIRCYKLMHLCSALNKPAWPCLPGGLCVILLQLEKDARVRECCWSGKLMTRSHDDGQGQQLSLVLSSRIMAKIVE